MSIQSPYLLFIGDVPDALAAKTAQGVVDWRPERCAGQMRMEGCGADLGIPDMTIEEAVNAGGVLKDTWIPEVVKAIEAGMDIASGLHVRLQEVPEVAAAADTTFATQTALTQQARAHRAAVSVYWQWVRIVQSVKNIQHYALSAI